MEWQNSPASIFHSVCAFVARRQEPDQRAAIIADAVRLNRADRSSVRIHFAAKNSIKPVAQAAAGRSVINTVLARAISTVDHTLGSEVTRYSLLTH
jgi:hypothetical protein